MKDEFRVHEVARVKYGKYEGLVGLVTEIKPDSLRLKIEGVKDGQEISTHKWYKLSQVKRNHGQ